MATPDAAAAEWLKANGVPELFDTLTARLVAEKPADVVQFLTAELQALAGLSAEAQACAAKMRAAGAHELHIRAFLQNHKTVAAGATGTIPEGDIVPVAELPELATMSVKARPELVKETVVLKLNGGLGTGMGLSKAKSLLPIKDGKTFLDYIAQQVLAFRESTGSDVRFMLMNSFSTSDDTKAYLSKYPAFAGDKFTSEVEVMQGKTPKVSQATLKPAAYPEGPENEWCPPGHGELYCSLQSSGALDALLAKGFKYMFVSNSDNLGATLDLSLLTYLADEGHDFLMEVCQRTESDKKGGHLARDAKTGALLLRESAQCAKADEPEFQNVGKHRFFNTNNLWINLPALRRALDKYNGVLPLPTIRNSKTVDPTNAASEKVFQLETAMGTAISCFDRAAAVVVPRSRFAPVKTCTDLLNLCSDCYEETPDKRLVLIAERNGVPPVVSLEDKHYKFVDQFTKLVADGVPSMRKCARLTVVGPVTFAKGVVLEGDVKIVNDGPTSKVVPAGTYTGEVKL
uniref:UTP--glucose-1-phosphate uridylyltransferase n=1 Tax=Neobodo designis TaxID=312471 RepID=A0A7S1MLU4_NEODS|mmetsp:Transcript_41790/g.129099  ORF Transcript_41790/g.129099 Transcript_41790/m.129099 type:complete len:516 (+) Transcript_41790:35-1582(+)